jgi:ribonuclease D
MEAPSSDATREVIQRLQTTLVTSEGDLRAAVDRLSQTAKVGGRLAVDIESNGLFKYKATLCTMQLATRDEIVIVDTITTPLGPLAQLLGPDGPQKIVHDVAFDARILAEANIVLANVLDTSVAARMLGRTATGLASLLGSELGIKLDKKLQHHDWTERPLRAEHLCYLADDVVHLEALAGELCAAMGRAQDRAQEIAEAVEEETRYRLSQAIAAAGSVDKRPVYLRLKGIDRVPAQELAILRRLAEVREAKARSLDVPPYKVLGPDVLFAIARARPKTLEQLARIKGASAGPRARSLGPAILEAVAAGLADGAIPDAERMMLERPRPPQAFIKARKAREARLTSWRRSEANKRGVDEQVVLPGHCLQDLADLDDGASLDAVAAVPGIGAFRVARDGPALVAVLAATEAPPVAAVADDSFSEPQVEPS